MGFIPDILGELEGGRCGRQPDPAGPVGSVKDFLAFGQGDGGKAVQVKMKFADIVEEFLHTPSVLFTYLGYVGNTFVTTGLMNWLPTYYHRVDGLPMDKAGLKTSVVFLLAIFGAPIGGYITDKIRKKFLNARMIVPAITSFLTALFLFIGKFSFLHIYMVLTRQPAQCLWIGHLLMLHKETNYIAAFSA